MMSVDKYLHKKTDTDSVFEKVKYPTASWGCGTKQWSISKQEK